MSIFGNFFKKGSNHPQSGKWQVGDKIGDHFEVQRILGGAGKSGMGIVYVGYDDELKEYIALKTFQEKYLLSKEARQLFKKEALIWTKLGKHPNIVAAYLVRQLFDGRLLIALEYIAPDPNGRNILSHYLGNLTLPDILKFSIQFCYGMEYAYSKGIDAHRDIKPDNIMITSDKTVKITDFGLAKVFQEIPLEEDIISQEENPSLSIFQSKGKRICGTLPYMAPEQFDGFADRRSDIYAFGIVLYRMITNGKFPFIATTPEEYERLHRSEIISYVSSPLFPMVQKCLEKDPAKRYRDFATIKEELQKILRRETGETIIPPKEIGIKEVWEWNDKGLSLHYLEKYEEALACFDKALKIDPRYAIGWNNKGLSLMQLDKKEESIACFDKALELNPKDAEAWVNKGVSLCSFGRFEEAIACCDKAIKFNPGLSYAHRTKQIIIETLRR